MKHELKIYIEHWTRVFEGTKLFEIRNNDRAYQKGDEVSLNPFCPKQNAYIYSTDRPILYRKIGDVYPVDAERVVFSLLPMNPDTPKG